MKRGVEQGRINGLGGKGLLFEFGEDAFEFDGAGEVLGGDGEGVAREQGSGEMDGFAAGGRGWEVGAPQEDAGAGKAVGRADEDGEGLPCGSLVVVEGGAVRGEDFAVAVGVVDVAMFVVRSGAVAVLCGAVVLPDAGDGGVVDGNFVDVGGEVFLKVVGGFTVGYEDKAVDEDAACSFDGKYGVAPFTGGDGNGRKLPELFGVGVLPGAVSAFAQADEHDTPFDGFVEIDVDVLHFGGELEGMR